MSDLIDFIKELKTEVEQNDSTYVYYEKENGNIVSISSSFDESLLEDQEVIKVSQKQALPLLIGDKKTSDYIVIYDIAQKQKVLKEKNYQDLNKEAGDMCHKLPNVRKNNSGHVSCEEIYEGMDVFFWQKTLSYKKDDIVWYKNNVYKLLESNYKGRSFSLKKSQLIYNRYSYTRNDYYKICTPQRIFRNTCRCMVRFVRSCKRTTCMVRK